MSDIGEDAAYHRGLCEVLAYLEGQVDTSLLDEARCALQRRGKGVRPGPLDDGEAGLEEDKGKGVHTGLSKLAALVPEVDTAGEVEGERTKKRKGKTENPSSASCHSESKNPRVEEQESPQFLFWCGPGKDDWRPYSEEIQEQLGEAAYRSKGQQMELRVVVDGWEYRVVLHPEPWPDMTERPQPLDAEGLVGFQYNVKTSKVRLIRLAMVG